MNAADAREGAHRVLGGVEDARLAVPEQAGGEVAEQVDVLVTVGVRQHRSLAADKRERERLVRDARPRVAARQD